ncbi:GumC family protein [Enterobacillus tribolii]|uniref:Capsular exopolysaccharide synthesis family protein n=1 Tax=Enterobacillus tribolii TaxID=1487935 RepID=A0A370QPX0_9GAMM|nr:polysaccharide biosynthesis tyrosine autokinase [Enterobacillus tribolii]MBW7981434.1 capsular biosynthesis protein [Enterobacillus tribolii]RDK90810.1 capsular exopolysaccharide synthesis family protein [Enterobacillus tribolii]
MKLSMVEQGKKRENVVEFSRYTGQIRKRIWRLALVALVTALVAYPLIRLIPAKYVATSTLMIKALPDDATPLPQLSRYDSTRSDFYETQYSVVQSRVVLEKAIQALGLDREPTFNGGFDAAQCTDANAAQRREKTLKNLVNALSVSGVRNTQLITVSFESPSAETAARVANGVAQAYIDDATAQKRRATEEAQRGNQQQMERVKQQMVDQKAAIDAFLKQEGLLTFRGVDGFETEQLGIVTNRLADATQRRIAAQSQYDEVRQALARHAPQDIISLPDFSGHAQIQDLRIALTQTRRNLAELRKRYGPKHDKILEAQAQVNAVNGQIGQVLNELARGAHQQYQAALDDENRYRAMLDQQKADFGQLAGKRDRYNTMAAALEKTQALYQTLYQRAHEQALSVSLIQPDAVISDPAVAPERPSKPNKTMLWIITVMLVTLAYFAWLIVGAALNNTLNAMSQLAKRLNLTALGELPQFGDSADRRQLAQRILSNPASADLIHGIRTNLLLSTPSPQVLAIISAEKGEGRSLVAQTLAASFSTDQQTLLVDMDYVNEHGLSAGQAVGLADVLQGNTSLDGVLVKQSENLTLLPRGKLSGSPLLILTSQQLAATLQTLRARYQRIIIDCPAFHQAQDGMLTGRLADGVLLVAQAGRSQAGDLLRVLAALKQGHNTVTGAVLNQVDEKNLESQEGLRMLNRQVSELITPANPR